MVQRITISQRQYEAQNEVQNEAQGTGAIIRLQADQVHYLIRVLRLKVGDRFIAQNGRGQQWLAQIALETNKAQVIETLPPNPAETQSAIRLIAALPKGNSFDEVVRQTTELGVTHIHPVIAQRTLLRPSDNKLARWRRIAQEASEQSERITVPEIFAPVSFEQCMKHPAWTNEPVKDNSQKTLENPLPEIRYICAARSGDRPSDWGQAPTVHLLADLLTHQPAIFASVSLPSVILAIGPEGGWTSAEITVATDHGYKVVSLGSVILRAVTAPITALSLVAATRDLLI